MELLKKSLRAKFTLIFFVVGVLPLAATSLFFYYTAKDSLFKNVFKELNWSLEDTSGLVEDYFEQAQKDLLIASRNTAFTMYFIDPANRHHWVVEQQKSLRYLRSLYPDMLDEACFIEASGKEVARVVLDEVAGHHELSSDERRTSFFMKAFATDEGAVFQGVPTMSHDTARWVLPNATPIVVNGRKEAILHFEVTLTFFQRLLKKHINPDRGQSFIIDAEGRFIAHTGMEISETGPFPMAVTPNTPDALKAVYARMTQGESGIEGVTIAGEEHYVIFKPVRPLFLRGVNENSWSIGYSIPAARVYVETDILKYNLATMSIMTLCVMALAYVIGNYVTMPIRKLASATNKVAAGEMPSVIVDRKDELGTLSSSFNMMVEAIKRRDEALQALASTDGLTGLYNFRHFREELDKAVKTAVRYGRSVSLIMADVDHFKRYNDTNGHANGDACLKRVAGVFMYNVREVDTAARYGGEEFAVILPETDPDGAMAVAERIRRMVEAETIPFEELQPGGALTISVGVATLPGDAGDAQSLIEAADRALYMAKENGRNVVCPAKRG